MGRPLIVFLPLPDDDAAGQLLLAEPATWLPDGSVQTAPGTWSVPLRGAGRERQVTCSIGEPRRTGTGIWRALSWDPDLSATNRASAGRLLPDFRGEVGVARIRRRPPSLLLAGTYEVPGGVVGELVDAVMLCRVARRTATDFLADISADVRSHHPVSA